MDICTQTETQEDIFKRHEQEDFDGILNTEKYLNQSLDPSLSVNEREFALSSEFARALEDILIAKNNYQRVILQMMDTIYNQRQRLEQQSVLFQLHNTMISRNEAEIDRLKKKIASLEFVSNSSEKKPELPVSLNLGSLNNNFRSLGTFNSLNNDQTNQSQLNDKSISQKHFSAGSLVREYRKESNKVKKLDSSIECIQIPKQGQKFEAKSLSQRQQRSPKQKKEQKRYLTPNTERIATQENNDCNGTIKSHRQYPEGNKNNKTSSQLERRKSDISHLSQKDKSTVNSKTDIEEEHALRLKNRIQELCNQSTKLNKKAYKDIIQKYGINKEKENISQQTQKVREKKRTGINRQFSKSILTIQEDALDEYESVKIARNDIACKNDTIQFTMNTSYSQDENYILPLKDVRMEKYDIEPRVLTEERNISFQSATQNFFPDTEENDVSIGDVSIIREANNYQQGSESVWALRTFEQNIKKRRDAQKRKELAESSFNLVTSPSFGMQTSFTERSFSQNPENKHVNKSQYTSRKEVDQKAIGKVYGTLNNTFSQKKWTPIFPKKN